jgi:hypothetical protein
MKQFGTFESWEDINKAADGLRAEGDTENIKKLAQENGIPDVMAEAYIKGGGKLCDAQTAAIGALEVELKGLKGQEKACGDMVVKYLTSLCEKQEQAEKIHQNAGKLKKFVEETVSVARKTAKNGVSYIPDDEIKTEARKFFVKGREPWKRQK